MLLSLSLNKELNNDKSVNKTIMDIGNDVFQIKKVSGDKTYSSMLFTFKEWDEYTKIINTFRGI